MRVRRLVLLTALVSAIIGAVAGYLALTVPNDLRADSLLKEARAHLTAGKAAEAHDALSQIIQRYPRTDAAAAATVALVKLEEQQRERIQAEVGQLRTQNEEQSKAIGELRKSVEAMRVAPAPAKATVEAKPAPAAKTTAKKPAAKKKPTAKKRRR